MSERSPKQPALAVAAALAVGSVVWLTAHAMATDGGESAADIDANALRTDAEVIAADRGIPVDDMERYLRAELDLVAAAQDIESSYRDSVAGIWIDWRPEPVLVVRMVDDTHAGAVERLAVDQGVQVEVLVVGGLSRDHLVAALSTLHEDLVRRGTQHVSTYVDERTGDLVVEIPADSHSMADVEAQIAEFADTHQVTIRLDVTDTVARLAGPDTPADP